MKALVLAGGSGTRLRPFTYSLAKQLVPVANKPVLVHCLENIAAVGISEVGVIVGNHGSQIQDTVGDGAAWGLRITYLPQEAPLGLAHCVVVARDFLGDDDFLMYLGDNVFASGVTAAAASFRARRPDAQIVVAPVTDPRHYGVAEVDPDGRVLRLEEKPQRPRSNLAVTGAYFFTPVLHEAIGRLTPSGRGELEITDALALLVATGRKVTAERYAGYWKDTGKVDDLLECNRVLLEQLPTRIEGEVDAASRIEGPVVVEAGARIIRSELIGPVAVAAGSTVRDSRVGPNVSVGPDSVLDGTSVEDSITLTGVRITGVQNLRRSLIGQWALVDSGSGGPHNRLIIGDHAQAEVPA
jgi:glucose-1-phosphate thymidylyltransferase